MNLRVMLAALWSALLVCGMIGCKEKPKTPKKKVGKRATSKPAPRKPDPGKLVIYSGRSKKLVKPIIEMFEKETKIKVSVKYAKTAQLALMLQQEVTSKKVNADLFWAQDAGALGLLEKADAFGDLPDDMQKNIPEIFRSPNKKWVATSGRARVLAYSPKKMKKSRLPKSVFDLTKRRYRGKVGWAPTNASFQAFVTAMRVAHGDKKTKRWLKLMKRNKAKSYPKNTAIIKAIAAGEVALGLPNHYYLLRFKKKDEKYPVEQTFFKGRDIGNLVNVAGVGILKGAKNQKNALAFLRFLLSKKMQQYITSNVFEYPLVEGVKPGKHLVPLKELLEKTPKVELGKLSDLKGTLKLLRSAGVP